MTQETNRWDKLFTGFGILAIISGIFLVIEGDYLIGVSGSMVGALIVYQNLTKIQDQKK